MLHYQALQQVAFPFLYQYNLSPQSVTIHGVIPFPVSGRPQWRCHILTSPWSLWFSVHKYMNIFTYNCMGFFLLSSSWWMAFALQIFQQWDLSSHEVSLSSVSSAWIHVISGDGAWVYVYPLQNPFPSMKSVFWKRNKHKTNISKKH